VASPGVAGDLSVAGAGSTLAEQGLFVVVDEIFVQDSSLIAVLCWSDWQHSV
jgi:hypothetical protein